MAVMNQEIFAAENGTMLDWDPETLPGIDTMYPRHRLFLTQSL